MRGCPLEMPPSSASAPVTTATMAGRPGLRLIGPLLLLLVREGAPLVATTHRPVRQLRQLASGQHGAPRLRMQQEWEGQPRKQRRGEKAARPGPDYARNQICCYGCGAELQVLDLHMHTPWPRAPCHARHATHTPCHTRHAIHATPYTQRAPCRAADGGGRRAGLCRAGALRAQGGAAWSKAVPQLGACASSGRACWLWLARHPPRESPGHWAPRHRPGCSSSPPPRPPIPPPLTVQALHKQLRQTLCARCRAMAQGQILPAVVEGRLGIEAVAACGLGLGIGVRVRVH